MEQRLYDCSIQNGHTATAQLLIEAGADVNQAVTDGSNAFIFAAQDGHTATAQLLIEAGADVNQAQINNGTTPLFYEQHWQHKKYY